MAKFRAIIMAAGAMKRWRGHLGVAKYLIPIGGEPLVERTVRLLKERGVDDIRIVTNHPDLKDHPHYYAAKNKTGTELDRFINGFDLMIKSKQTLFLYGDVFYTEEAIHTILSARIDRYAAFGRSGASSVNGKTWGELFAFRVKDPELFKAAVEAVYERKKAGEIDRAQGWEVYRQLVGVDLTTHQIYGNFIEIDDWTNDFDQPKDYQRWIRRWRAETPGDVFKDILLLLTELNVAPRGVIHVGANRGQEAETYERVGFKSVTLVEPLPDLAKELAQKGFHVVNAAIAETEGRQALFVSGEASSLYQPLKHRVEGKITVPTKRLDSIQRDENVLVVDAQGAEMAVLRSGTLDRFDLVIVEASNKPRYEGGSSFGAIDRYLKEKGFALHNFYWHSIRRSTRDCVYYRKP